LFASSFPEWVLPNRIVLKRQKKGWDEEFDDEIVNYEKFKPLQGVVIPVCYGQTEYRGVRALVLSDIGGACVAAPEGAILTEKVMRGLFDQALRALAELGATHDDLKLDNFHLVEKAGQKAIMVLDLERVNHLPNKDTAIKYAGLNVNRLVREFRSHLECLEDDGLLIGKLQDLLEPAPSVPVVNMPMPAMGMFAGMRKPPGNLPPPPPFIPQKPFPQQPFPPRPPLQVSEEEPSRRSSSD